MRHAHVDGELQFDCPQFAGAVTATLTLSGSPQFATVRASAYPAAELDAATLHAILFCATIAATGPPMQLRGTEIEDSRPARCHRGQSRRLGRAGR